MKIISYNVNGIRAAINKGFMDWLVSANPDVICLQEIKAMKEQLDLSLFEDASYKYHYWFSAQKKDIVALLFYVKKSQIILSMELE